MSLIYHTDCEQGGSDWLALRAGRITSSDAKNVLPLSALFPDDKNKRDNAKGQLGYALRLATERVTGQPVGPTFNATDAMTRGTLLEPEARDAYAAATGHAITTVAFISDEERLIGDSPDGLVYGGGESPIGGVEIKCVDPAQHWEWREGGEIPREHLRQMLHHLHVVQAAAWWDFFSWHPCLPGRTGQFRVRLTREAAATQLAIYAAACNAFEAKVQALVEKIRSEA